MIYLEKEQVLRLVQLGFKPFYDDEGVNAQQFYNYQDEEWSIGDKLQEMIQYWHHRKSIN